jgi:DNA-binding SARP family transcriptional activator
MRADSDSLVGTPTVELHILGPVEAFREGRPLSLGGPKQRAVLAMLLLDPGRVIPSDRLVDELWRSQPPPGAAKTLRSYMSRLRGLLSPDATLRARGGGYVLELKRGWLDATRFEVLTEQGQDAFARGNVAVAAESFREGLALWHGSALADVVDVETLALEGRRLDELRLLALEGRIEAELELGLHAELIGELESLVAEHPLRERFWLQLVLALYRSERQADALAAYRRARDLLAEEFGLVPSEELQRLEQAVLRHEVRPFHHALVRTTCPCS